MNDAHHNFSISFLIILDKDQFAQGLKSYRSTDVLPEPEGQVSCIHYANYRSKPFARCIVRVQNTICGEVNKPR